MKIRFLALVLSLIFPATLNAAPVSPVTYTYQGALYDSVSYSRGSPDVGNTQSYEDRGSYKDHMRLEINITFNQWLPANTQMSWSGLNSGLISFHAHDGLNNYTVNLQPSVNITTGADGRIVDWGIQALAGHGGADVDMIESRLSGDQASYTYEYAYWGGTCRDPYAYCETSERASARSNAPGTWSGGPPAAVPLPASALLLIGGIGALALGLRRTKARVG